MATESILVEIRAGEGGDDAKLLVREQARVYERYCARLGLQADLFA